MGDSFPIRGMVSLFFIFLRREAMNKAFEVAADVVIGNTRPLGLLNPSCEDDGFKLVHGEVLTNGQPTLHAWAEKDGMVFDFSGDVEIIANQDDYYATRNAVVKATYDHFGTKMEMVATGHCGPWAN